jgi:tetratricopeptide (TPR) repeat protein
MSVKAPRSSSGAVWLFGPARDLLLGCGLGWMAILVLHGLVGGELQRWIPGALLVLAFSLPHYGATLLRVYETSEERRRYALFAVYGSLLLALAFVGGLRSALVGSLVLTLYVTWSPWHYTGQNYGVLLMLLGRRGVRITPTAKRLVHASFVLSYVLTFLAIHGVERTEGYAPASFAGTMYRLMPLGIPYDVAELGLLVVGVAYVASLLGAGALLLRCGRPRALAVPATLFLTQALWFSAPVLLRNLGSAPYSNLASLSTGYAFLWIAAAHAVQYLWVTSYYAAASGRSRSHLVYLGKAAVAGHAVWTLPALLLAPRLLGDVSYDGTSLALLVAAVVNLHHFVLDGAIWKLRDGRIARLLVRSPAGGGAIEAAAGGNGWSARWLRRGVWAVGLASVTVGMGSYLEARYGFERALRRGDVWQARRALDRLAWVGRDGADQRSRLGREFARQQVYQAALGEFERSLALRPSAEVWRSTAEVHWRRGRFEQAARAFDEALALDPQDPNILYRSGLAWLETGRPEEAAERLGRAVALAPDRPVIAASLERARRSLGREPIPAADGDPARSTSDVLQGR